MQKPLDIRHAAGANRRDEFLLRQTPQALHVQINRTEREIDRMVHATIKLSK